jgi:hypothetical protein
MRLLARLSLAVIFIAGISHAAPASSMKVAGLSQQELTVRWWQWAASFDYPVSPVSDMTGERCAAGQEGEVWFLAGTYSSSATRRTCRVPAGKYLFFPLINYVVMPSNCSGCLNCEQATASPGKSPTTSWDSSRSSTARRCCSRGASRRLRRLLRPRGAFPLTGEDRAHGFQRHWLLLPPLAKGRHTLRFGGALPSLRQELIYTLTVE